jgi:hypothetical protein
MASRCDGGVVLSLLVWCLGGWLLNGLPRCFAVRGAARGRKFNIAGLGKKQVQGFRTLRDLHWEFLRLWTGFELPSSWRTLPAYGAHLNRNILDFMRWPQIDLGAQDLNDIQRPKSFHKNSWK